MAAMYRLRQALQQAGTLEAALRIYRLTGLAELRKHQLAARYRRAGVILSQAGSVVVNPIGVRLRVLEDDRRAHALYINGGCLDSGLHELWRQMVELIRPDIVIDAGANYGDVSLSVRYDPNTRIVMVEPNPRVAACLQATLSENSLTTAEIVRRALSDTARSVQLNIDSNYSGTASIVQSVGCESLTVEAERLDRLVDVPEHSTCLLKIDVEGHELAVLRGAEKLLERCALWIAVSEYAHLSHQAVRELHERYDVSYVDSYTQRLSASTPQRMLALQRSHGTRGLLKDVVIRKKRVTRADL